MEKDDEIKGQGNSYDFGARIYDPRIGRWNTRDPLEETYPAVSTYAFALNSPLLFKDPNGKEAVVTVQKNPEGGGEIIISSIVYVTGNVSSDFVNNDLNNTSDLILSDKTIMNNGEKYTIKFNIVYEYVSEASAITLEDGDNIITVSEDNFRSHAAANATVIVSKQINNETGEITQSVHVDTHVGNKASISKEDKGNANTYIHETLHLLGLSDRYTDVVLPGSNQVISEAHDNFESDIMGNSSYWNLSDTHFMNWIDYSTSNVIEQFILKELVDVDKKTGELKGDGTTN